MRALTPVRENFEKRAAQPELRDVFLCHAWDDRKGVAKDLHDLLESRDVSIWFSEKDVPLGSSLLREIDRGVAGAIAELYDDWQEVLRTAESHWSYSHPKFIQFTDDAGNYYLAGFDAEPRRSGSEHTEIFRVMTIDGEMIADLHTVVRATVKSDNPGVHEEPMFREVEKRLLALEPAFGFMAGHFSKGYRPAIAVAYDIDHYGFLDRSLPFHEISELLKKELAEGG